MENYDQKHNQKHINYLSVATHPNPSIPTTTVYTGSTVHTGSTVPYNNTEYIYTDGTIYTPPQKIKESKTYYKLEIITVSNGFRVLATKINNTKQKEFIFTNLPDLLKWVSENIDATEEQQAFIDGINSDIPSDETK